MTDLTVAEQLLLVALDDDKGADTANWGGGVEAGLAGAILLELSADGCLTADGGKLVAADGEAPDDPLARTALDAIRGEAKPRDAKTWIGRLQKELKPLRERVAERLVERGVLGEERRKRLGLFETTRYPERDPEPETRLRTAMREVLVTGREPTAREAMLASLLHANDLVKRVVAKEDRRAAGKRAKAIAEGDAIGAAVGRTVSDVQAATMAAVTAATTAATISSSSGQ